MEKIIRVILCLLMLSFIPIAIAEEDGEVMEPESNNEAPETPTSQPRNNSAKPIKEFIPSEEISVDRPVAFPVDI